MVEAGFSVSDVTVSERPMDGALGFGFTVLTGSAEGFEVVTPENGGLEAAQHCGTQTAAASVGRLADW